MYNSFRASFLFQFLHVLLGVFVMARLSLIGHRVFLVASSLYVMASFSKHLCYSLALFLWTCISTVCTISSRKKTKKREEREISHGTNLFKRLGQLFLELLLVLFVSNAGTHCSNSKNSFSKKIVVWKPQFCEACL